MTGEIAGHQQKEEQGKLEQAIGVDPTNRFPEVRSGFESLLQNYPFPPACWFRVDSRMVGSAPVLRLPPSRCRPIRTPGFISFMHWAAWDLLGTPAESWSFVLPSPFLLLGWNCLF